MTDDLKHGRCLRNVGNVGRFLPGTIHSNRYWPLLSATLSIQFALLSHSTSVVTCVFYRQKFKKSQTNYCLSYFCYTFWFVWTHCT